MAKSSASAFAPADRDLAPSGYSLTNLWQMPLLLVSLGLFTLAAYVFIDPSPAPSFQKQLARAERDLVAERYDAALGRLNDLLATQPEPLNEAAIRILIADTLDEQMQRSRLDETPHAHRRIVNETLRAHEAGLKVTADAADRVARSYDALGRVDEASANYRLAVDIMEGDDRSLEAIPIRRSSIELLIVNNRPVAAAETISDLLKVPGIADDERAWALGELARINIDLDRPAEAMSLLAEALALSPDETIKGQVNFRLGYAAWKLGDDKGAHDYLQLARRQIGPGHYLDAEACYLLGRIAQNGEDYDKANGFYQIILRDHPGNRIVPKAMLGIGVCQLVLGHDDEGVTALIDLAGELSRKPALVDLKGDLVEALQRGGRILANRENFESALDLLAHEQAIAGEVEGAFFARLGLYFERFADQLAAGVETADELERPQLESRIRGLRAGDAYVAYSRKLTLTDDAGYGEALWKGIELYEQSADPREMIAALELFCAERPGDPIAPEATYRLGRAYQSIGRQDAATATYNDLRMRYPQTLAAAQAAVPLAEAYVAQGKDMYPQAEGVLRAVVDDNPLLSPASQTFRDALWGLSQLYHKMGRFGEAVARFDEFASRYPEDERVHRAVFYRADSYRQAALVRVGRGSESPDAESADGLVNAATQTEAQLARGVFPFTGVTDELARDYLQQSAGLFAQVVERYRQQPPATELEKSLERMSHFYRADCLFDLGEFEKAIELYSAAADRYQDDPSALAAYVQIVNAYCAMSRFDDARVANERAKWLLRRIPPEAFQDGGFNLSREYWEQRLRWTSESGMW
jgi:tetratricopeptide (TPR) repeat protein